MKPLNTETQDADSLLELGRASLQIVHDLKNQINGLKLYATFLRKRFEAQERPLDERETIAKIIAGLERAAADMTILVRFGRPLDLQRQPHIDLTRLLREATLKTQTTTGAEDQTFDGTFDAEKLGEALKTISAQAGASAPENAPQLVQLRREDDKGGAFAVIEWLGLRHKGGENLFGSFAGSGALRMALAAKIIRAHSGDVTLDDGTLRARLPLKSSDE